MDFSALPQKSLDLDFTLLNFYEDFVVSEPREGVVVKEKELKELAKACLAYYRNRSFVYISHRNRDYSLNPVIYLKLKDVKNLLGIAVVTSKVSAINSALFEKSFSKVPFEIFLQMDEATEWVLELRKSREK